MLDLLITIGITAIALLLAGYTAALWKIWQHPREQGQAALYSILLTIITITLIGLIGFGCWILLIYTTPLGPSSPG